MKKLILSVALVAISSSAFAQQRGKMQKKDPAKMEQKRADHLQKMKANLNLNDAQVSKIKALQDQKMAERKKNVPEMKARRKAKMEEMKAKRMQHQTEIKQILTPEQYQKWQASNKEMMQKRGKMMKGNKMQMREGV